MSRAFISSPVIALDAMGGDNAPLSVLSGANKVALAKPKVNFLIYGNKKILSPILNKFPVLKKCAVIKHTDKVIASEDKPSYALRNGKDSSMWQAIDAVKKGEAHAVVSAGNTGALMAIAKLVLRTLPQIHRPAITTIIPNVKNKSVMLDLGANVECSADNLFQFALMGNAFAKVVLGIDNPSIGILNIGSEDVKGNEAVKEAGSLLRKAKLGINFAGFIEGNDIAEGTTDVIVTDGFSGNIALKTLEGTAKACKHFIKTAFGSSLLAKLGFIFALPALKSVARKLDHRLYNGAMFLGLNGIVVKSHGSADDVAFASAIDVAVELAAHNINDKIGMEMAALHELAVA